MNPAITLRGEPHEGVRYAADGVRCWWRMGNSSTLERRWGVSVVAADRTDRNHSASGHTVSPLLQRGQREIPVKMTSQPTQKSARSNKICS